jgi:gluconolactonase
MTPAADGTLVAAGATVRRVATGFGFIEGPVWNRRAQCLLFSDLEGDVRRRYSEDGAVTEVMRPSNKGNGMVYDAHGRLLVCEHSTSTVVREHPDGTRETIASHYGGQELNSPNDIVTRSDGTVYFSDPAYGRAAEYGVEREQVLSFQGVYRIPPVGGEVELAVPEDEFEQPNGLCLSPDESLLYIDDDPRGLIRVYDVEADGRLGGGRTFFTGILDDVVEGTPDGMKCDAHGNVWVTGPGGVWVISPAAERLAQIDVPEVVANLAWGGADWKTLYLTASTSLYCVRTSVVPAPLPYHR